MSESSRGDGRDARSLLVSDAAHQRLERGELKTRRRWRFKAKGTPEDLKVYTVKAAG
jgi:hypothetical protein